MCTCEGGGVMCVKGGVCEVRWVGVVCVKWDGWGVVCVE